MMQLNPDDKTMKHALEHINEAGERLSSWQDGGMPDVHVDLQSLVAGLVHTQIALFGLIASISLTQGEGVLFTLGQDLNDALSNGLP